MRDVHLGTIAIPSLADTRLTIVCFSSAIWTMQASSPASANSFIVRSWLCGRRTSFGHDQRLICEIGDGHALLRCERMMIGDRYDGGLMKEKHKPQPLIRAFGRADKSKIDSARQKSRQQAYRLIPDQLNRDIRPLLSEIVKQHRQKSSGST